MYYINWRVCARVCFYVLATVCVSVCFSEEYVLFLHAAKFHNISRNYWSAALDISISNLIQTWVLPRDAEFHQRKQDEPNIVNTRFFSPHAEAIAETALKLDASWNVQKTWYFLSCK